MQSHAALHGEFLVQSHAGLHGEFLIQSHAALHGEFFLQSHTALHWGVYLSLTHCAGLCREHLLLLVYMGSFSYMPSAGLRVEFLLHAHCWFTCGVSLTHHMLASFSWEFLS